MANYSKKNRQASDKYYTKPETAKTAYELLKKYLKDSYCIIEPCAGDGKLMDIVDVDVYGFDLFPERSDIVKNDFLENPEVPYQVDTDKTKVTFANPPFGSRGSMCKVFIDEALKHSDTVGFIVPNSFKTHCKKYRVIDYVKLPLDGFTYADKDYEVNCWMVVISNDQNFTDKTKEFLKADVVEEIEETGPPELYNIDFFKDLVNYKINKIKNYYGIN